MRDSLGNIVIDYDYIVGNEGLFPTPEDYGAAGDNSTDDETAFTNALTAGEVWLTPGKTYYVSNLTLPSGSVIYFNGATIRGGLTGGAGYKLIGPGTVTSNEGDGRPFTGHNSSGHYCRDITYCYAGTTGVDAVVYFAPESNLVEVGFLINTSRCPNVAPSYVHSETISSPIDGQS